MGKKRQILDITRICAALMVFTVHFFMFVDAPSAISRITANFSSGVALFFVISGYLMMESLEHCRDIREYMHKRVVRILPSYYAILLVAIVVWDIILGQMPSDELGLGWIRYFLFLNTIVPSKQYYFWNDLWGLWTFSCFMVFYLLAPFLKKIIKNYKQSLVFLGISIVGGYAAGYVMEYIFVRLGYSDAYIIAGDSPWINLNIFAIGMCMWYALREHKERSFMGVCGVLITVLMLFGKQNRISYGCAAAVIILAFWEIAITSKIAVKIIDVLSRYSFSLYLVHLGVIEILDLARQQGYIRSNILFALLCIVLSAAAAVLLYQLVERPAAKLLAGKNKK
jgi:peptidoglycan/LPS O-acetylase OafA/YrhL